MKRWMWWALGVGVALMVANRYVVKTGGKPFIPAWLDFTSRTVGGATRASTSADVSDLVTLPEVGDVGMEDS